jgi:putative ATPase
LAVAPKSNAVYVAYRDAARDAHNQVAEPVPLHLRNAPTRLMKDLDYGKGYEYAHDHAEGTTAMTCLPESLSDRQYYRPSNRGLEKVIAERIAAWRKSRDRRVTHD